MHAQRKREKCWRECVRERERERGKMREKKFPSIFMSYNACHSWLYLNCCFILSFIWPVRPFNGKLWVGGVVNNMFEAQKHTIFPSIFIESCASDTSKKN